MILEKWSYVGDVLWGPTAHFLLVTRAMCSMGAPYVGCMCPSVVVGLTTGHTGKKGWTPGQLVARLCLMLLGRAGSPVAACGAYGVQGLVLACWWIEAGHRWLAAGPLGLGLVLTGW